MGTQNHERCERAPMEPHTIHYGVATVVGVTRHKEKRWIIPGGYYTTSKRRAESVAALMDALMRRAEG